MTIKKKLKGKSGFTLAETLLAVLIMLLVSVIVANGIPVARNVYNNVIVGANAQVLLSTAVSALRNELGTAQKVEVIDGTNIVYFNSARQAYSRISVPDSSQTIQLEPYIKYIASGKVIEAMPGSEPRPLVSKSASNGNLIVTYEKAAYDPDSAEEPDIITISNIEVKLNDSVLVSLAELKIRLVSKPAPDV